MFPLQKVVGPLFVITGVGGNGFDWIITLGWIVHPLGAVIKHE